MGLRVRTRVERLTVGGTGRDACEGMTGGVGVPGQEMLGSGAGGGATWERRGLASVRTL